MTTTGLMCLSKHGNMFLFGESGDSACNECLTNQPTNWEKTLSDFFTRRPWDGVTVHVFFLFPDVNSPAPHGMS